MFNAFILRHSSFMILFSNIKVPPFFLNKCFCYFAIIISMYGAFWAVFQDRVLPGTNLFSFIILFLACYFLGELSQVIGFPPLLGMLVAGILLGNVEAINIARHINLRWSVLIKSLSLVIILIHGGLECDTKVLVRLKGLIMRLACVPCIGEAIAIAIVSHYIIAFPWAWAFVLGFVLTPLSPAVIVPQLIKLQEEGHGVDKGIPTLILAASSIDGTIAIMGFAIFQEIALPTNQHKSLVYTGLHAPLELIIGLVYGFTLGILFWHIPSSTMAEPYRSRVRFTLLSTAGIFGVFGGKVFTFSGAGALGTLCVTLVANYGWFKRGNKPKNVISRHYTFLWNFFQPLLFGLIGSQMDIDSIQPNFVGYCVLILLIGLCFRVSLAILCVFGIGFNWKEKVFVGLSWIPKATVQAAIGSLALDSAISHHLSEYYVNLGRMVLVASIIVILVTAPIGAIIINTSGPRLLSKVPLIALDQDLEQAHTNGLHRVKIHEKVAAISLQPKISTPSLPYSVSPEMPPDIFYASTHDTKL